MAQTKSPDELTVMDVFTSLRTGASDPEDLGHWFNWPPDLFLLASFVLKKTGAYREVVHGNDWKETREYAHLPEHADEWLVEIQVSMATGKKIKLPAYLNKLKAELTKLSKTVRFTDLKVLRHDRARKLGLLLVEALALADIASPNFGLLGHRDPDKALTHYFANLLLVTRGTLSSLPKHCGIVLPKMRTPQTGLTIRSFSLHLAYQETEVEVMWRSVPWMNRDQNTINVLCVPWPKSIGASNFFVEDDTFETIRLFKYQNNFDCKGDIGALVSMVKKLNREVGNVHMIVLPELALRKDDYSYLLELLKQEYEELDESRQLKSMPMVISGICDHARNGYASNVVKLAVYFAGKWYDLQQTKHHRWKLTTNQVMQYELSGKLSTHRSWFENISLEQRKLSFFVPNNWLALCPLICEDLAQLEPVSEIIRGVGPTLLIAVLMDGPQIKERWPARYASIFADDPGTAVLTLTSTGMIGRSAVLIDPKKEHYNNSGIALWKDQVRGWKHIEITPGSESSTALLTISANYGEEFTADGRSDDTAAAVFKLDNVHYPPNAEETCAVTKTSKPAAKDDESAIWRGDWQDLRELTNITFAIDALISLYGAGWSHIKKWITLKQKDKLPASHYYSYLINLLADSYVDPKSSGQDESSTQFTKSFNWGVEQLNTAWQEIFQPWREKRSKKIEKWREKYRKEDQRDAVEADHLEFVLDYYQDLVDQCSAMLNSYPRRQRIAVEKKLSNQDWIDKVRIERAVYLAILMSVHNRLDAYRVKYQSQNYNRIANVFKLAEKQIDLHSRFQMKHQQNGRTAAKSKK